jgi:chromosome segregation ATPase
MAKQEAASRPLISEDLALVDQVIADHEKFQTSLYVLRRILGEVGKVDAKRTDLDRGVEAEQARLDEVRKQADAAQQQLDQLNNQIKDKQRELASVEQSIQQQTVALNQLHEGYHNLRNILAAA